MADDPEVVGDEDVGERELLLEVIEEIQHLRLDRDVQGRDGLVGDDQLRPECEGPRDPDPLPLAAGEFMREPVVVLRRETDGLEQVLDPLAATLLVVDPVDLEWAADDRADALAGVQARVRILEHDLHLPPNRPQRASAKPGDVTALEQDAALGGLEQADDRPAEGGLAAAGLADQPEGFAFPYREGDVVHRVHARDLALQEPFPDREVLLDVPHFDEGVAAVGSPSDGQAASSPLIVSSRRRRLSGTASQQRSR